MSEPIPAEAIGRAARLARRALASAEVYRRLYLLERRLDAPIEIEPLPADVRVERLGEGDVGAYRRLRPDQDAATWERRWARGDWCLATWRGGAIVGSMWIASRRAPIDYLDLTLHLDAGEVYSYDLYAAPFVRGRGLTRATRPVQLDRLRSLGHRRLLGSVSPDNLAAWATQRAAGFRRIALVGYAGVGPWRRYFCVPVRDG